MFAVARLQHAFSSIHAPARCQRHIVPCLYTINALILLCLFAHFCSAWASLYAQADQLSAGSDTLQHSALATPLITSA